MVRSVTVLVVAMAVGGAALLQVGCVDEAQGRGSDELVAPDVPRAPGGESVSAEGDFWMAPFISVVTKPGSSGKIFP